MFVMDSKSLYAEGQLFVAAIRILENQNGAPPALAQIAKIIGVSIEQTGLISRRLREAGIVDQVEGAYDNRWVIADHLKLEGLPRDVEASQLDSALKKFQSERSQMTQKIESIKQQQAQKQKDLFADIEKKLKKDLSKS
jgi:hypothetical protein